MLREDTGRHFLDSGLVGGRHWERNILKNHESFAKEPAATVKFELSGGRLEIEYTRNVFHFLRSNLEFDQDMTLAFESHAKRSGEHHYEGALLWLESMGFQSHSFNSYNQVCNLSQTIQFHAFGRGADVASFDRVALQIHNGCDVRGGYTHPRVFRMTTDGALFMVADGRIRCDRCAEWWATDDNRHWYHKGCCGLRSGARLELYDAKAGEEGESGLVVVADNGVAFCPRCGEGRLEAST